MIELSNYLAKKYYLFNNIKEIYNDFTLNYIDIGSAHNKNLFINYLKKFIKIKTYNFDAFTTIDDGDKTTISFKNVLSDEKKFLNFFENVQPQTSSIYPVSDAYREMFKENFKGRSVRNQQKIEAISLDELNLKNINIIKIDTQGYNYEILQGAKKTLNESFPVLIIEAWNFDIYKQNFNIGDQISILKKMGYVLLDIENSHSWRVSNNYNLNNAKRIFVGCEMIFIKEDLLLKNLIYDLQSTNNVISVLIFLDIWGFKSLILKIIEKQDFLNKNLKNDLIKYFSQNSQNYKFSL